jgi:riboflavin synthase
MFTGIIQSVGEVREVRQRAGDVEIIIDGRGLSLADVAVGDSIAASGCCLTVTRLSENGFAADVSLETLSMTTLGSWVAGSPANLEKALRAGDALGGHYVTGHVDGVAKVVEVHGDARSQRVEFEVPLPLARYIARKGSVCIDGTSLTVNEVSQNRFGVNLIPHTLANTVAATYRPGTLVNLEVDIIARYVERMFTGTQDLQPGPQFPVSVTSR